MPEIGSCTKDSCPLAQTGLCEKGHETLVECENYVPTPPSDTVPEDVEKTTWLEEDTKKVDSRGELDATRRSFGDGEALDISSANQITGDAQTQIIVLAGEIECGKTTLLATLYEKFQSGPFAGYIFGGSRTIRAFEQKCHLARVASQQIKPDTERTKVLDPELLHLVVRKRGRSADSSTNLLFTDVSGERFRMIRDSAEECKKMDLLARADHFAVLLDGAQLADKNYRQRALQDSRALLRSVHEAGMIGQNTFVEIIFSKWDLIQPQKTHTEHTDFVDAAISLLTNEFSGTFRNLQFFSIASRSQNLGLYPFAYKVAPLFKSWVQDNYLSVPEKAAATI